MLMSKYGLFLLVFMTTGLTAKSPPKATAEDTALLKQDKQKTGDYCERPEWRPYTKYEDRGERLGHEVRDMLFQRT